MNHPNKHIRKAIKYAESRGWRLVASNRGHSHVKAKLFCPAGDRTGHRVLVRSTPRNPEAHARDIRAEVDRCPHSTP